MVLLAQLIEQFIWIIVWTTDIITMSVDYGSFEADTLPELFNNGKFVHSLR